ncbi:MAG: isoprenylcysteine carboxylmethyltransferase family protein [Bacteroidetes bacterium]|nr:isoprenylcysteine carboxylmethyltransferase family protein [Bacteroidota bacterium]
MEKGKLENSISNLSSYSVIVFAIALFVAVLLDVFFEHRFFSEFFSKYFGLFVLLLGTFVIYWAQNLGRKFTINRKRGDINSTEQLERGPYKYSRNPKYVGLALLVLGLGFIVNSIFIVSSAFVSVFVINFFMIQKEEAFMSHRHGNIYGEYKKKVRRWL